MCCLRKYTWDYNLYLKCEEHTPVALTQTSESKARRGVVAVKLAVLFRGARASDSPVGIGFFLIQRVSSWLTVVETGL